jgi:hypothetical protein
MRSLERQEPSFVDTRLHDHLDKQCGTIRMMSWSCSLKPRPAANVRGDASCKVAVPSSSPSRRLQEGHLRGRAAATLPHSKTACSLRQDSLLASLDPSFSHKSSEHNARANLHASRLRDTTPQMSRSLCARLLALLLAAGALGRLVLLGRLLLKDLPLALQVGGLDETKGAISSAAKTGHERQEEREAHAPRRTSPCSNTPSSRAASCEGWGREC